MKRTLILLSILLAFTSIKPSAVKAQTPTQEYYHEITNDLGTFKIWLYMTENSGVDHVEIMDPDFNTWSLNIESKVYGGGYGDQAPTVTEFSGSFPGYHINWAGSFDPAYGYQPTITAN